ncbi:ATP-binding cassette domain-containing protein [Streptomyces carpaticus]|uniref:ATP-binding cassette domain-containing protein n=1 Tax=Streptomyces carpaticus TaxID=285558 RepID=A0ABV4ZJF0_9ACTN
MATTSAPAIATRGLTKSYADRTVLTGLDLTVAEGSVFALLGPNGAGKTTTVQILTTLVAPDAGQIRICGHDAARDPGAVRRAIGVTGQFAAVDPLLTTEENMWLMADLHHLDRQEGRSRSSALLSRFDLAEAGRAQVATLSGGMRRKLDLAMTLVGRPRVLFLDEPTTGLDPRSRRTMWEIIRQLVAEDGVTVFLTTQYLEEADQLADRIALLDGGRIIAEGTADQLKRRIPGGHIRLRFTHGAQLDTAARAFSSLQVRCDRDALTLDIPGDGSIPALRAVLDLLDASDARAEQLTVHTPDLDDVFLTLTHKEPAR